MECDEAEWTKAAEAAEKGLKMLPQSASLRQVGGYACNKLGRELLDELQWGPARKELVRGKRHLEEMLVLFDEEEEPTEEHPRRQAYRSIVLIIEGLIRYEQNQVWASSRERDKAIASLLRELGTYLERWARECPDDPRCSSERDRLFSKFPELEGYK